MCDKMVDEIIDKNGDIGLMTNLIFSVFKDDKNFDNLDKIRVGISEEIFRMFMGKAEYYRNEAYRYEEGTEERMENYANYVKIYEMSLKLKDANYKDKIMRNYGKLVFIKHKKNSKDNKEVS
jgi:hypothetical protein